MMSSTNASDIEVIDSNCTNETADKQWQESMNTLYTYVYLFIFIPGLIGNSLALWVLCRFIRSVSLKLLSHDSSQSY